MAEWAAETTQLAAELTRGFEATHGFEPGDNYVRPADRQALPPTVHARALVPQSLADFYGVLAEAHLPDVHCGFFVEPLASVLANAGTVHPAKAAGAVEGDIVVFGTTGGGDLIAMTTDERVYIMRGASGPWPVLDAADTNITATFPDLAKFLAFLQAKLRDAVADLH